MTDLSNSSSVYAQNHPRTGRFEAERSSMRLFTIVMLIGALFPALTLSQVTPAQGNDGPQAAIEAAATVKLEIAIAETGTYVISVPPQGAITLVVNGAIVIDANQPEKLAPVMVLAAGRHTIALVGSSSADFADLVLFRRVDRTDSVSLRSLQVSTQQANSVPTAQQANSVPTAAGTDAAETIRSVIDDANAILNPVTPPPPTPPVIDGPSSSPLSPPVNTAPIQAIEINAGASRIGQVASTGQTLFGRVQDFRTFDQVAASIAPAGRETMVDVSSDEGRFAIRLFANDLISGNATVTVRGVSSQDDTVVTAPVEYVYTAALPADGLTQVLSRLTYGATPELYARIRTIGADAYIREQLNPAGIDNTTFEAMNAVSLLPMTSNVLGPISRGIVYNNMAHAAYSDRQLYEIMGQFWWNHFYATTKNTIVYHQNIRDRQFYRDNAFGNFEDLLLYSARSPLMSQFLDNDENRLGNLNENYAREILELHTVGSDAGYNDDDIVAVARIFTGWDYVNTNRGVGQGVAWLHEFDFRVDRHDTEDKFVPYLGMTIPGRSGGEGVTEGEELISILANHDDTKRFVCGKIVQKFVADVPPALFVDACVEAWTQSNGSTVAMLRAILTLPAFTQDVSLQRIKGKTPYEYSMGIMRFLGVTPPTTNDQDVARFYTNFRNAMEGADYDPLAFGIPTGFPETGEAWSTTAAYLSEYRNVTTILRRPDLYNFDFIAQINDAGLSTAEEVAAYLLTLTTADRFEREEFETIVVNLKGPDGVFDPLQQDERRALDRAVGILITLPSLQLQ